MFALMSMARKNAVTALNALSEGTKQGIDDVEVLSSDEDDQSDSDLERKTERLQRALYWKNVKLQFLTKMGFDMRAPEEKGDVVERPHDYWYDSQYHEEKHLVVKLYLDCVAKPTHDLLAVDWFNNLVIWVIIVAGINVGMQTYEELNKLVFFTILDYLILSMFLLECAFKIFAEGLRPWMYWLGPEYSWNNFDFGIILLSLPIWDAVFQGGNSVAMLRLIRLARLGKLIRKIPALQMIMSGLMGGLSSVGYILLLLFLVFYLYGIVGFYLYSGNDPFHFGSLPMALLMLFRISLLENWSDIMYLNIMGCDSFLNMYVTPDLKTPQNTLLWCDNPSKHPIDAPLYFISFVVISAFVMLSLFVGAITMSMSESMEELKHAATEQKKSHVYEKKLLKMEALARLSIDAKRGLDNAEGASIKKPPVLRKLSQYLGLVGDPSSEPNNKITSILKVALGDVKARKAEEGSDSLVRVKHSAFYRFYSELSDWCSYFVENAYFSNTMTGVIIIAGINVGVQTDLRIQRNESMMNVLTVLDSIILAFFTLEVVLKIIAEKFRPSVYFQSNWNRFDFLIVIGSFVPGVGSGVTVLRLLRLLRVLKLVKRLPQLAVIINALINGMGSIGYIGVILFLVFYVFSILGIILFADNDPWHFGSLHLALITLFRISTLDNVTAVMFISMFGCDNGGVLDVYSTYPDQCTQPSNYALMLYACVFFIVFVILAAQVLLTLFIGVISTSMDEAREANADEQRREGEVKAYAMLRGLSDHQVKAFDDVFQLLDLDGTGLISDKELKLGLVSVNMHLSDEEIVELTDLVDPNDVGINLVGFMKFMLSTPKYRESALASKLAFMLRQREIRLKQRKPIWPRIWLFIIKVFPFLAPDENELMNDAAIVLQGIWRTRQAKLRARAHIEKKLTEMNLQALNDDGLELTGHGHSSSDLFGGSQDR